MSTGLHTVPLCLWKIYLLNLNVGSLRSATKRLAKRRVDIEESEPSTDLMLAVLSNSDQNVKAVNFEKLCEVVDLLAKKGVKPIEYGPGYETPLDFAFFMEERTTQNVRAHLEDG